MACNPKSLNNFTCIPNPSNPPGSNGQLIIADGNEGTLFSTSLLGQESAVLSAYVAESFEPPVGGWTVPANTPSFRLIGSQIVNSGDVVLGLDTNATTNYFFSIFNPFTGANLTTQRIIVHSNYSVNFTGGNTGECGVWIQVIGADLVVKPPRYGVVNQRNISVANGGNNMTGSTIVGLEVGESAAFFVKNTANATQVMIGGDIDTVPLATKFQSALIN